MRSLTSAALGIAAVVIVVAVILIATGGSSSGYHFSLHLKDANGLINGSNVTIGGVPVGTTQVGLGPHDEVVVTANLDKGKGPIGRDASVYIAAINLLGQKRLEINPGNAKTDPAPNNTVLPSTQVSQSTDLDQVLDVLSPNVRDRLAILLNEAGSAVAGRKTDIANLVSALPPTIDSAEVVLNELSSQNGTLSSLVQSGDQTITTLNSRRTQLNTLIDTLGQGMKSVALKKTALSATLADAPATLSTAQRFLTKLQQTASPLGSAASEIAATAPSLDNTIKELPSFVTAAEPAVRSATAAAPELTALADKATPVVRKVTGTVGSLATFADTIEPATATLNHSEDNLIATVSNWSRAVEGADSLGHTFRGELSITDQTLLDLINRSDNSTTPGGIPERKPSKSKAPTKAADPTSASAPSATTPAPPTSTSPLSSVVGGVQKTLGGVAGAVNGVTGTLGSVLNQATGHTNTTNSTPSVTTSSSVQTLLNYLLK